MFEGGSERNGARKFHSPAESYAGAHETFRATSAEAELSFSELEQAQGRRQDVDRFCLPRSRRSFLEHLRYLKRTSSAREFTLPRGSNAHYVFILPAYISRLR